MNHGGNIKQYIHFGKKKSLAILWKVKQRVITQPSNFTPRNKPEKNENISLYQTYVRLFIAALFITSKKY